MEHGLTHQAMITKICLQLLTHSANYINFIFGNAPHAFIVNTTRVAGRWWLEAHSTSLFPDLYRLTAVPEKLLQRRGTLEELH